MILVAFLGFLRALLKFFTVLFLFLLIKEYLDFSFLYRLLSPELFLHGTLSPKRVVLVYSGFLLREMFFVKHWPYVLEGLLAISFDFCSSLFRQI